MIYETELINSRKGPLTIYDRDGAQLVRLEPGQAFKIYTENIYSLWARWSRVDFQPAAPWVDLTERQRDVPLPANHRWVTWLNVGDGAAVEHRVTAGGQPLALMKGVPVRLMVPEDSPDAAHAEWRVAERYTERVASLQHDGLFEYQPVLRDTHS